MMTFPGHPKTADEIRCEVEANQFAYAFLMPEAEYRESWKRFEGDTLCIANHFSVPLNKVLVRAKQLGLAS